MCHRNFRLGLPKATDNRRERTFEAGGTRPQDQDRDRNRKRKLSQLPEMLRGLEEMTASCSVRAKPSATLGQL